MLQTDARSQTSGATPCRLVQVDIHLTSLREVQSQLTSFLIRKMIELNLSFGAGSDVANQGAINVQDFP
jgi:hypothetical protein